MIVTITKVRVRIDTRKKSKLGGQWESGLKSELTSSENKRISESTCLGLADAMIINALQCSRFPFVVSSDFDVGYAVLASKSLKDVVMPDSVAKKYRDYHFDEQ